MEAADALVELSARLTLSLPNSERRSPSSVGFSIGPEERIYAVGDIHGRSDLFASLLAIIAADSAARPPMPTRVIVLGDLIDRGPDSADVVRRCQRYSQASDRFVVLQGNHEQVMYAVLAEGFNGLEPWLKMGGDATLRSWGVSEGLLQSGDRRAILSSAQRRVPQDVLSWMNGLPRIIRSGDVVFVHAGIRPNVSLERQKMNDLLWIGEEFRDYTDLHPFLVVHGHWISENGPEIRPNRIGIDTGAYRTGRLTALGLQGGDHWVLST